MNRRRLLVALGTASTTVLAGCSGSGDEDGTPEPDTDTPRADRSTDTPTPDEGNVADRTEAYDDLNLSYTDPMTTRTLDHAIVSPYIKVEFSKPITVHDSISFTVENLDTGAAVTAAVSAGQSVETDEVALALYRPTGELQRSSARIYYWSPGESSGRERLDAEIDGDDETFSARTRATYRTTMFRDDDEVGTAGEVAMSVGHSQEFDYERDGETLTVGFNAGELPTDGELTAKIQTGDGVESESVTYDEAENRFVATFDTTAVPSGEHRVTLHVTNPETGRFDLFLGADLQV